MHLQRPHGRSWESKKRGWGRVGGNRNVPAATQASKFALNLTQ